MEKIIKPGLMQPRLTLGWNRATLKLVKPDNDVERFAEKVEALYRLKPPAGTHTMRGRILRDDNGRLYVKLLNDKETMSMTYTD